MSTTRRTSLVAPLVALVIALALALVMTVAATPADAQQSWAPVDEATIHPGVQMFTDGAQCTANFVFTSGSDVLIGYAAHCAATGASTDTNGCLVDSLPLGTPVEIDGATRPGTLAYSSWGTMRAVGETDPGACNGNDFALVRIDPADVGRVNPSLPTFGGPQGIDADGVVLGDRVFSYGNSGLRPVDSPLSPKDGIAVQTVNGGWTHTLYTASPGIPGDSGSAFLNEQGQALGIVSTLALAPLAASNNIADAGRAIAYANERAGMGITLAEGTEPFTPALLGGLLPIGL